jgi:hypothetical protein
MFNPKYPSSESIFEPRWVQHRQKDVLDALKQGAIEDVRISQKLPVDELVLFGLKENFLQKGLRLFPDPRKSFEVPIDVILLSQILQRLTNEHSLLLAPYMLNSAELITRLGYNVTHLTDGFNDRAVHKRQAPFHGEVLKHILMSIRAPELLGWFNRDWLSIWRANAPGRTRQYILDGTDIEIPEQHVRFYDGAGTRRVEHKDGSVTVTHGYKIVWLAEIIDRKSVIVTIAIGPIQTHDLELARPLLDEFDFEPNSSVICDRGFIDSSWITRMKQTRGVDFFIPLKKNMAVTQAAISYADNRKLWKCHPTRDGQMIAEVPPPHLFWEDCTVLAHGVLSRWVGKDGEPQQVLFVTTQEGHNGKSILATYDQRSEIEEDHRQIKCFQGLATLPSKKLSQIVFRILMGVLGFNLMQLFLNSEACKNFEQYSLKTLRQKRVEEKNPEVIIYTATSFAVLRQYEFLPVILKLKRSVQKRLIGVFEGLHWAACSPGFS